MKLVLPKYWICNEPVLLTKKYYHYYYYYYIYILVQFLMHFMYYLSDKDQMLVAEKTEVGEECLQEILLAVSHIHPLYKITEMFCLPYAAYGLCTWAVQT